MNDDAVNKVCVSSLVRSYQRGHMCNRSYVSNPEIDVSNAFNL